ncbi:MAG: restriction endonuclease [Chloroflexi bacterium]|nr:restriction endonuclease [Chloroflexota bacterium]
MTYDFGNLSPDDFERLCADLLSAELGFSLEEFGSGADRGIDLRHTFPKKRPVIVQCKHYPERNGSYVRDRLKKELKKVKKEKPSRYIVATSARLIPDTKDAIASDFSPYISTPADVFGRNDLESILRRNPDIERRHIKLWLPSEPALLRALNHGTVVRSESTIEIAKSQVRLYVPNPSFLQAQEILEKEHVCILSGRAGIGKTMLAHMIAYDHARQNWEIIQASRDISDADDMWSDDRPQLFIYDDFLGRTMISDKLSKNEDQRLLEFMARVQRRGNKRFILTTREYILAQARSAYPRLSERTIDPMNYVIPLDVYTRLLRGKILYNHLYFAGIRRIQLTKFVNAGLWRSVVDHEHYSPRSIEIASRQAAAVGQSRPLGQLLLEILDNPDSFWTDVYTKELTVGARFLLCVLASLPEQTAFDKVQQAWAETMQINGWPDTRPVFETVADELEGTFVTIERAYATRYFEFVKPAIRDWLTGWLGDHPEDLAPILGGITFFDQIEVLASSRDPDLGDAPASHRKLRSRLARSVRLVRLAVERTLDEESASRWEYGREVRLTALARLYGVIPDLELKQMLVERLGKLPSDWPTGYLRRHSGVTLIRILRSVDLADTAEKLIARMSSALVDSMMTLDDMNLLITFAGISPEILKQIDDPDAALDAAISDFNDTVDPSEETQYDYAESVVRNAAALFDLPVGRHLANMSEYEEEDGSDAQYDPSDMAFDAHKDAVADEQMEDAELERLFASL